MVRNYKVSLRLGKRQGCPLLSCFFQHCIGSSMLFNKTRLEKKKYIDWKEEMKLSLFTDDMIVYVEHLEELRKTNLLDLLCDYRKVAEYKVNIQKSVTFLYTINEQVKFEIKNTI